MCIFLTIIYWPTAKNLLLFISLTQTKTTPTSLQLSVDPPSFQLSVCYYCCSLMTTSGCKQFHVWTPDVSTESHFLLKYFLLCS